MVVSVWLPACAARSENAAAARAKAVDAVRVRKVGAFFAVENAAVPVSNDSATVVFGNAGIVGHGTLSVSNVAVTVDNPSAASTTRLFPPSMLRSCKERAQQTINEGRNEYASPNDTAVTVPK